MTNVISLDRLAPGRTAIVHSVQAPAEAQEWDRHLQDLGFLPGERVHVLRRAALGGDPLMVRVGSSTYALRRAEAGCVRLCAEGGAQ